MGRGRHWSEAENMFLMEMAQQGLSLNEIVKSGKFEGRTPQAIAKQMERLKLGFFVGQKQKSIVEQIGKAEIPEFEELYREYEQWEEIKARIEKIEADVKMLMETRARKAEAEAKAQQTTHETEFAASG